MQLRAATVSSATRGTVLPGYDRTAVQPGMVHIGPGNFHRAHQAVYLDSLLASDPAAQEFGLVGVHLLPHDEHLARALARQDRLYTVLQRGEDGTRARIVGSIVDNLWTADGTEPVLRALADPRTRIVSLTITERGYHHDPATGTVDLDDPGLRADRARPGAPVTAFGHLTEALRRRRAAGAGPFTVVSCDNIVGNGDLARTVLLAHAATVDPGLADWIGAEVAFPNTMVDRITPRTSEAEIAAAEALTGLRDEVPVPCEEFIQWVVEDRFAAGRPAWEAVGVQVVDDVAPFELMKLRLLNAGHQAIAHSGALLGHEFAWQACADPTVRGLLEHYLRHEGVPAVGAVPGVDLTEYCATVVRRMANRQMPDTVARLRDQSSTMLSTFVLPVARQLLRDGRDVRAVAAIVACWALVVERGRDEDGRPLELVDVRADELRARARDRTDPLALVHGNPLFAGLDDDPRFTGAYAAVLRDLRQNGVRRGLDALLASTGV